jgi:hypothetical protein
MQRNRLRRLCHDLLEIRARLGHKNLGFSMRYDLDLQIHGRTGIHRLYRFARLIQLPDGDRHT